MQINENFHNSNADFIFLLIFLFFLPFSMVIGIPTCCKTIEQKKDNLHFLLNFLISQHGLITLKKIFQIFGILNPYKMIFFIKFSTLNNTNLSIFYWFYKLETEQFDNKPANATICRKKIREKLFHLNFEFPLAQKKRRKENSFCCELSNIEEGKNSIFMWLGT